MYKTIAYPEKNCNLAVINVPGRALSDPFLRRYTASVTDETVQLIHLTRKLGLKPDTLALK